MYYLTFNKQYVGMCRFWESHESFRPRRTKHSLCTVRYHSKFIICIDLSIVSPGPRHNIFYFYFLFFLDSRQISYHHHKNKYLTRIYRLKMITMITNPNLKASHKDLMANRNLRTTVTLGELQARCWP